MAGVPVVGCGNQKLEGANEAMSGMEEKVANEANAGASEEVLVQTAALNTMSIKAHDEAVGPSSKGPAMKDPCAEKVSSHEKFELFIKLGKQFNDREQLQSRPQATATAPSHLVTSGSLQGRLLGSSGGAARGDGEHRLDRDAAARCPQAQTPSGRRRPAVVRQEAYSPTILAIRTTRSENAMAADQQTYQDLLRQPLTHLRRPVAAAGAPSPAEVAADRDVVPPRARKAPAASSSVPTRWAPSRLESPPQAPESGVLTAGRAPRPVAPPPSRAPENSCGGSCAVACCWCVSFVSWLFLVGRWGWGATWSSCRPWCPASLGDR